MGLYATAKGLTDETCFNCGYITYGNFILNLVKAAYDDKCYEMYEDCLMSRRGFSQSEVEYWNAHCNDDLDILIWHSDCNGKFTPKECRKIYNALKNLKMDMEGHNYLIMEPYNMLEHWKNIFKHCADRRVNLYYC